jgi:crotonobetainyl-CoA:carnitine CoA-transferase CaiB-like acyl-CoA transferase
VWTNSRRYSYHFTLKCKTEMISHGFVAHGADVILVTSPNLPALPVLDADTSRGKRTTQLDLLVDQDRRKLDHLVQDCDVFMQAYRPGGLANKGFGVADVVQRRPGIVYASINAWGWNGPWKDRRGVRVLFINMIIWSNQPKRRGTP